MTSGKRSPTAGPMLVKSMPKSIALVTGAPSYNVELGQEWCEYDVSLALTQCDTNSDRPLEIPPWCRRGALGYCSAPLADTPGWRRVPWPIATCPRLTWCHSPGCAVAA